METETRTTYKLKCQYYAHCGNTEERTVKWAKVTCFSCKMEHNRKSAKIHLKKLKAAV